MGPPLRFVKYRDGALFPPMFCALRTPHGAPHPGACSLQPAACTSAVAPKSVQRGLATSTLPHSNDATRGAFSQCCDSDISPLSVRPGGLCLEIGHASQSCANHHCCSQAMFPCKRQQSAASSHELSQHSFGGHRPRSPSAPQRCSVPAATRTPHQTVI